MWHTLFLSAVTHSYVVAVPPKWSVEPFDVSVERNRNVALHCQAHGVPAPTVTWKKATGNVNNVSGAMKHK